jgi:hypothetical protein
VYVEAEMTPSLDFRVRRVSVNLPALARDLSRARGTDDGDLVRVRDPVGAARSPCQGLGEFDPTVLEWTIRSATERDIEPALVGC